MFVEPAGLPTSRASSKHKEESGGEKAYQVILEPGIGQFREFEPRRVHPRTNWLGLFLVLKLTCGKRDSVSEQHPMKTRLAVGLLSPMHYKNGTQEPGGRNGRHL